MLGWSAGNEIRDLGIGGRDQRLVREADGIGGGVAEVINSRFEKSHGDEGHVAVALDEEDGRCGLNFERPGNRIVIAFDQDWLGAPVAAGE